MNKNKKISAADVITVLGILFIIYGFALTMLISPDKTFSEEENRVLQTLPRFSMESLISGKFTKDVASYCTDQMPLRNIFVGTKAVAETVFTKRENNGVILGKDEHIIAKSDYTNYTLMDKNISAINTFAASPDFDVSVAIAGRSQDVLFSYIPDVYPAREISDAAFANLNEKLTATQIDILAPLRERAETGEYVYYRTDHHWTTLGAYYAYAEIISSYGIEPYPIEYFTREMVSEEFYGTTWSKAGMKWISPDSMEFFRFEGDDGFVCEIVDNGKIIEGFYERSYLDKKDKYSTFIGGNNGRVKIYADTSEERETLVLIKDSFRHSLAPFLAAHFDLDIIDLRYYKLSVKDVITEANAKKVLVIYNMDSLVSSDNLKMLTVLDVAEEYIAKAQAQ